MLLVNDEVTLNDCRELAQRLRDEDLKEIQAVRPEASPLAAILECVLTSSKSYSVIEPGLGCIAVLGVRNEEGSGIPWLLSSEHIFEQHSRQFIKQSRQYLHELTKDYERSYNYVSSTNTKAIEWLKWLGFEVHTEHSLVRNGVTFHPFTLVRNIHV